jgi:Rod binding domain-containing protein
MSLSPISAVSAQTASVAEVAPAVKIRGGAFNAAAVRNAGPAEQRKAVAAQFEAILVRQLLGKTMTSMLGSEGGVAGSVYGDMLADTISQQLTAGPGLGLGRYLEQQLAPRGAATATARSVDNRHTP